MRIAGIRIGLVGLCVALTGVARAGETVDVDPARDLSDKAVIAQLGDVDVQATTRALEDMARRWGTGQGELAENLRKWREAAGTLDTLIRQAASGDAEAIHQARTTLALRRRALLANPAIDFDEMLVVREAGSAQFVQNWLSDANLRRQNRDNSIEIVDLRTGRMRTLHQPEGKLLVRHVDLDYDGKRILFTSPGQANTDLKLWSMNVDGSDVTCLTPDVPRRIQFFDGCWLPDGDVVFCSTANYQGVPCIGGRSQVANLAHLDMQTGAVRMLCYDQDHNWCPTVRNDGRVMFLRWEYTDTPHYFTRLMMTMNPDGTAQREYYGSNSYWPNGTFFARPIPGDPARFVGIVSGHHDVRREGQMIVFDPAQGRREAEGATERIGWDRPEIEPVIKDGLVRGTWPIFVDPYPLAGPDGSGGTYFLASRRLDRKSERFGIFLVDVFGNQLLVAEAAGQSLIEPIPLGPRPRPTVIPDRVDLQDKFATVYLTDIYHGPGLEGVPRGTVKRLRIFTYNFGYWKGPASHNLVGIESSWEPKVLLGTVPVEADGSASFRVPANLPIAVQPLDADGAAMQLMRSWFTAQPGEFVSCTGCHEQQNEAAVSRTNLAARSEPVEITPWHGPARGFAFIREVQPVLDRNCAGCHDGTYKSRPNLAERSGAHRGYSRSYVDLHPYVRRGGPEDDYHILEPMEYHASTSELVQMLKKGHHGVTLSSEAWERLYTWIDLNAPYFGTWVERSGRARRSAKRRMELRKMYTNNGEFDMEYVPEASEERIAFCVPRQPSMMPMTRPRVDGWPLSADQAVKRRKELPGPETLEIPLGADEKGQDVTLKLVRIPAGRFVMGSTAGAPNEAPMAEVAIDKPFWMAGFEITNRMYRLFDPTHDSRYLDMRHKDHPRPGYPANERNQPVIRVSYDQARAFCAWLSERTGMTFDLPTEAQWEWACRAGTAKPFYFGPAGSDFSPFANLADAGTSKLVVRGTRCRPKKNPTAIEDFLPKDARYDDKQVVMSPVGKYKPNVWGLHDMHGNVSEWTRSLYRDYPYDPADGREDPEAEGKRVIRGGSWRHRPSWATASVRWGYESWQRAALVGFRVVCEDSARQASR